MCPTEIIDDFNSTPFLTKVSQAMYTRTVRAAKPLIRNVELRALIKRLGRGTSTQLNLDVIQLDFKNLLSACDAHALYFVNTVSWWLKVLHKEGLVSISRIIVSFAHVIVPARVACHI